MGIFIKKYVIEVMKHDHFKYNVFKIDVSTLHIFMVIL